jgi:hypothetical protein
MFVVEIARELSVLVALAVAAAAPGDAAAEAARSTEAQVCVVSAVDADSPVGGDACRSVLAAAGRDEEAEDPGDEGAEPGGATAPGCGSGERSAPADDEGGDAKTGDDDGDPGDVAEQDGTDDSDKARDEERDDRHDNKDNDEDKESKEPGGAEASRDTADGRDDGNTGGGAEKVQALRGGTDDDTAATEDATGSAVAGPAESAGCARGEDAADTSGASDHRASKGAGCVDSSTRGSSSGHDNARDDRAGDEDSRHDDADRPAGEGRSDGDTPEPSYPTRYDPRADGADANEPSLIGQPIRQVALQHGTARHPADLLTPGQWYLTLPTGEPGHPDTVDGEKLATFSNEFFELNDSRDGIVFAANAGGVTTKNSKYARSELREMDGTEKAAWSNTSGRHTLELCEAITKVPIGGKPEVVAAQIHDGNDDVLQIRLEDKTLIAKYADGEQTVVLDDGYQLGTPYSLTIDASDSKVVVFYKGQQRADLPLAGDGWYWKVGAYVQSNVERGADPGAIGEVVVHSVRVTHS